MQQVQDFLEECETLAALIARHPDLDWTAKTQFKDWTIEEVFIHLHFWSTAVDQALNDPKGFAAQMQTVVPEMMQAGLREIENRTISERGQAAFDLWISFSRDMAARWADLDPKGRVQWVGPDMSLRSAITARQMEIWAHGMEVFDALGEQRQDTDRIGNIVMLGINTYGWSHKVQGISAPETMPYVRLTAPSGAVWDYGESSDIERIEGSAVAFAQVVTQTRNVEDTDLVTTGAAATKWMQTAQCFAGPKETPPAKGQRFVSGG